MRIAAPSFPNPAAGELDAADRLPTAKVRERRAKLHLRQRCGLCGELLARQHHERECCGGGKHERARRIGQNEALFRDVNERIASLSRTFDLQDQAFEVVCECSDASCTGRMTVTMGEYTDVRSDPRRFLVLPGHQREGVERVVEEHADYLVIEKFGEAGHVAEDTDPRT